MIRNLEKSIRILKRLYFIRSFYRRISIEEVADTIRIIEATGYSYLKDEFKGYMRIILKFEWK